MASWPVAGETDWNTKMLAYLAIEHNTDGTHSMAGRSIQVVNTQTGAVATINSAIPYDDSIPQKTECGEVMTRTITPNSATNKLKKDFVEGKLHPSDLKNAVSESLIEILNPARDHFSKRKPKNMLEELDILIKEFSYIYCLLIIWHLLIPLL